MAKLFVSDRIVPAWLSASRHLNSSDVKDRTDRNLVLEIAHPTLLDASDCLVMSAVDMALRTHHDGLNCKTVAATIFPMALYRRHGRPEFYDVFAKIMKGAKCKGTWGTYALRMTSWPKVKGQGHFNPLEQIITRLDHAAHIGPLHKSAYELGVVDPAKDLDPDFFDTGCDLPTFDAARDGAKNINRQCLSHLSFKLTDGEYVDLTASYRSHYYAARALGNLVGLSQLLSFVATEAKLKVGVLTCLSTHAKLDVENWGGVQASNALLASFPT